MRRIWVALIAGWCLGACQQQPVATDVLGDSRYGNVNQEALESYYNALVTEQGTRTRTRDIWVDGRRYRVREFIAEDK